MSFIPDTPNEAVNNIPYFDDVSAEGGWQGHSTSKPLERLKLEVSAAIERIGGVVRSFQRGKFPIGKLTRDGFRIHYFIQAPSGELLPGKIDVAALPVRDDFRRRSTLAKRQDQSLKMALYMLTMALNGTWFLQQLSPGYAALMPFMLGDGERTLSQMWNESPVMSNLLPPGEEFVEAAYREV